MAAKAAAEIASGRDGDGDSLTPAELSEACRRQLRHDLKSLALRITNSHKWEDLVIPVEVYESLQEMISYVRHAPKVYEQWGFWRASQPRARRVGGCSRGRRARAKRCARA